MQESGNLRITFGTPDQATSALLTVKKMLSNHKYWLENVTVEENIIKVGHDVHIPTCDYPFLVNNICKAIAQEDPTTEFTVQANCSDDEGFYDCDESGYFRNQEFYFESVTTTTTVEVPDFDETDEESWEEWDYEEYEEEHTERFVTRGSVVNGKLVFE